MAKPLITVIIPVYKVEKYLARCVESVIGQTYKNLEIILVDDGSPDNCGKMCDEFAKQDVRIRVIHKENGGLSSARNVALDIMKGEYVCFVDSDDWVEPHMCEKLYEVITTSKTLLAVGQIKNTYNDFTISGNSDERKKILVYELETALMDLAKQKIGHYAVAKLYHKSIFDDIRFPNGMNYEDLAIAHKCIEKAQRIACIDMVVYHYYQSPESITRGEFTADRFVAIKVSKERVEYFKEKYPRLQKFAMASYVRVCLDVIAFSLDCKECDLLRSETIRSIYHITFDIFKTLEKKYKIKYVLFSINPNLYSKLMLKYIYRKRWEK